MALVNDEVDLNDQFHGKIDIASVIKKFMAFPDPLSNLTDWQIKESDFDHVQVRSASWVTTL